jgi:hypothetical protein
MLLCGVLAGFLDAPETREAKSRPNMTDEWIPETSVHDTEQSSLLQLPGSRFVYHR